MGFTRCLNMFPTSQSPLSLLLPASPAAPCLTPLCALRGEFSLVSGAAGAGVAPRPSLTASSAVHNRDYLYSHCSGSSVQLRFSKLCNSAVQALRVLAQRNATSSTSQASRLAPCCACSPHPLEGSAFFSVR